jgi:hypothetical protein
MLTKEEMEIFDEDFKHFAVANGVSNEEWLEMNQKNPAKAVELVKIFSDVVLQKVYEKVKYIENRSANSCLVFKLDKDFIELISINGNSDSVSLETPESIHEALVQHPESLTFFRTKKAYNKTRELEIHDMITQGCVNSSESFWILLEKVITT